MIHSYLINLDQDSERLAFVSAALSALGIDFERIAAIDGRRFSETDYQSFMQQRPRHGKPWLRGQMGCFLSHYAAWEKIARGNDRFYAVFEDDIHVSGDLGCILSDDQWLGDDIDIVRMETSTNRVRLSASPIHGLGQRRLYSVGSTSWCAGAYLINRRAARQLVSVATRQHEPADAMLYNFEDSLLARQFRILQFNPAPCTQDKHLATGSVNFASNIEFPDDPGRRPGATLGSYSAAQLMRAIARSLTGYKRIGFR
jgi:glycosyl transferase family 25